TASRSSKMRGLSRSWWAALRIAVRTIVWLAWPGNMHFPRGKFRNDSAPIGHTRVGCDLSLCPDEISALLAYFERRDHSGLIPEVLITLAHLSVSAAI